jgi:ADP-heptose:LPS heptosyltransferase
MRELSWLISREIKNPNPKAHCIERHLAVAKYLGCEEVFDYPIEISSAAAESVRAKLKEKGLGQKKIIAIHAGAGWLSRRWGTEKFAALAVRMKKELMADIVLIGGKEGGSSEKGLNDEILSLADAEICDMTGQFSLKELCAFLKICALLVGNEAGPMHIATALDVCAIALLGPTDALRTGPYKGKTKIIQKDVPCRPCRNRNCKNPVCMQMIKVDEVFDAVKERYESLNH